MSLSTELGASSTGSAFPWKYDVFLSFRGTDTRKGITDHLHKELERQGIRTFRDDPKLERGTPISPELLLAIEQSRSAIVVLSPNYATSTWCLLELCKIFECMEERGAILPIFYKVNPSHVRYQTGSFAKAFNKHKKEFGEDSKKVQGWRDALTKVANLAGWTSNDYRYETDLIKDVLLALRSKVDTTFTIIDSSEKLVGMDTKLEEMNVLLDRKANDVRFRGIWGMGGIGIHDLIQDMGCDIVRQESYDEPGGRSHLWLRKDVFQVFTKNTGTEAIEGIWLHLPELEEADWNREAFSKMVGILQNLSHKVSNRMNSLNLV
ncbi:hypothetical protein ACLB2K_074618 [Fragaria x ananassa]